MRSPICSISCPKAEQSFSILLEGDIIETDQEEERDESSQNQRSLLDYLRTVPDARQRQGHRYPLAELLAIWILAAVHGQSSLRGMRLWAQAHQHLLLEPLGFRARGRLPALTARWYVLQRLDVGALLRAVNA